MVTNGMIDKAIGELFGVSGGSILLFRRKHDIPAGGRRGKGDPDTKPPETSPEKPPEQIALLRELAAQNLSRQTIADQMSVKLGRAISQARVDSLMKQHGIDNGLRKGRQPTSNWGKTPKTDPMPGEIVTYEENGRTVKKLPPGYAYGISPGVSAKGKSAV
jgi:hypothetical protein